MRVTVGRPKGSSTMSPCDTRSCAETIRLAQGHAFVYNKHGVVFKRLGERDRAIADYARRLNWHLDCEPRARIWVGLALIEREPWGAIWSTLSEIAHRWEPRRSPDCI